MMNLVWGLMILIGVAFAALNGRLQDVTEIAVDSSKNAVSLAITMMGIVAMWSGLMKIAENSGMISYMTKKTEGILKTLFPNIPRNHAANKYIATNFIANLLGLGWAATPAGLKAMEELQKLNRDKKTASNEMCLFMVINMSSIQLISVNLLAYRTQYNSISPAEIIAPGIIVTIITTAVGVVFCKLLEKESK